MDPQKPNVQSRQGFHVHEHMHINSNGFCSFLSLKGGGRGGRTDQSAIFPVSFTIGSFLLQVFDCKKFCHAVSVFPTSCYLGSPTSLFSHFPYISLFFRGGGVGVPNPCIPYWKRGLKYEEYHAVWLKRRLGFDLCLTFPHQQLQEDPHPPSQAINC